MDRLDKEAYFYFETWLCVVDRAEGPETAFSLYPLKLRDQTLSWYTVLSLFGLNSTSCS